MQGCENNCLLTINKFNDGGKHITGNRCEKGAGLTSHNKELPNLYEYKHNRLFLISPWSIICFAGTIRIPRVLNMYENYPFWFTFLRSLDFEWNYPNIVEDIYEMGMKLFHLIRLVIQQN